MKKVLIVIVLCIFSISIFANKSNGKSNKKETYISNIKEYTSTCGETWEFTINGGSSWNQFLAFLMAIQAAEDACETGESEISFTVG